MRASELVKRLEKAIEQDGDLPVVVYYNKKSRALNSITPTVTGRYYLNKVTEENWIPYYITIWVEEEENE